MLRPPRAPAPHGVCEGVARGAYGWREQDTIAVAKPLRARLAESSHLSGPVRAANNALQVGVQLPQLHRVRALADVAVGPHEVGA